VANTPLESLGGKKAVKWVSEEIYEGLWYWYCCVCGACVCLRMRKSRLR